MSKHTPEPWHVDGLHTSAVIAQVAPNIWQRVAETDTPSFPNPNWRYDVRLIAAAPSMLAALQGLMEMLGPWETMSPNPAMRDAITIARNAIAKAKGGEG